MRKIFFIINIIAPFKMILAGGESVQEGLIHKHIAPLFYYASEAAPTNVLESWLFRETYYPIARAYALKKELEGSAPYTHPDHFWYKARKDNQAWIKNRLLDESCFVDKYAQEESFKRLSPSPEKEDTLQEYRKEKYFNEDAIVSILSHIDAPHYGALRLASCYGLTTIIKEQMSICSHEDKNNALILMTEKSHTPTVKLLLDYGADIHTHNASSLCVCISAP